MAGAAKREKQETWDLVRRPIAVERLAHPERGAPELIMLLCGDRLLGARVCPPGQGAALASELLGAQERPPAALRANEAGMAEVARATLGPGVRLSVEPNPAAEALADLLAAEILKLSEPGKPFPDAASRALLVAFHEAAAHLWAAQPWRVVPSERSVLVARTPRWPEACLQVIGQLGESTGLLLLRGEEDLARFVELTETLAEGGDASASSQIDLLSVDFERSADVDRSWQRAVSRQRLRRPARGVYPLVRGLRRGTGARYPDVEDLREATALAEAVARFVEAHAPALRGELATPITERYTLEVEGIPLTVEISAPHPNHEWFPTDEVELLRLLLDGLEGLDPATEDEEP